MVGGYKDLSSDPFFTLLKLSKLLANPRIVGNITQSNRVGSSKMTSSKSKLHGAITGPHQKSGFSYEKLCASILAFLTSFVFSNSANKTLLVTAKAAIISNQPSAHSSSIISGSKVLHFLLTSALPSGDGATGPRIPQAIRGIYFQLLISCLNNTSSSATLKDSSLALGYSTGAIIIKQKTALTKILTEHIENIVRKGGHEDLAAVPSLLEALAACLSAVGDVICHDGTAESDDRGPMVITTPDTDTLPSTFMVHGNFNSTTPHTLHTPLPALVRWIVESRSCFKSVDIMTSLVRCIGRVASCHHLTNGNLSSNGSSTRSKFLASVSSEDCIFLLVRSLGSSNYALRTSALISLWTLVHNSEQAKAVMKRSVEKLKSQDLLDIGSCIDNFVVTDEEIENDSNTNTGQVHSIDEISIRKARAALRAILSSN